MQNEEKILEALKVQPLTEEEKQQRHILRRLFGPIASCSVSTRNGRKYNRDLWQKALADDIFNEKVANKSLFLELGHPLDGREETDMEKVCACIPEVPKIIGDELYAYVDILDTKNGRLLKTLCDYGFIPGISSRGSGDILPNDEVDPETFFLETWDIVQIPALREARLSVCEGLDTKNAKLKKALVESYNSASEEDKIIMKEALENLNIDINESKLVEMEIPQDADEMLKKDGEKVSEEEIEKVVADDSKSNEEKAKILFEADDKDEADDEAEDENDEAEDDAEQQEDEPADQDEKADDEKADEEELEAVEIESDEETTVKQLLAALKGFDKKLKVEFAPIVINGVEYKIDLMNLSGDEDKVMINIDCSPTEGEEEIAEPEVDNNIESDDKMEVEVPEEEEVLVDDEDGFILEEPADDEAIDSVEDEIVEDEPVEEVSDKEEIDLEEAVNDAEAKDVIENLKELVRQKDATEKAMNALKEEKTVSDAKVLELQEELDRYKTSYSRLSTLAAKSKQLEADNKNLSEQLKQKDTKINELNQKAKLTEGYKADSDRVKALTESLNAKQEELNEVKETLTNENSKLNEQLQASQKLAKSYKAKLQETLKHYVDSKASMLGVRASEITSRLNESFSLTDIDAVCNELLTKNVNINRMPLEFNNKSRIKFNESKEAKSNYIDPNNGYDIDDSLLELAGLK